MRRSERGVVPVLGTILLVAIVIVLAAIVSVFALGLGESVSEPAPATVFDIEEQADGMVMAAHTAGQSIDRANLQIRGGTIEEAPAVITAGDRIEILPDSPEVTLVWHGTQNSQTLAQASALDGEVSGTDPALLTETAADKTVPVTEFNGDHNSDQYEALEAIALSDPFTLAVSAPALAGEESTAYAVVAYYDEFGEAPNDRLAGPSAPLAFDEDGIAEITIGSAGTNADVTTWIAPGDLSDDASLINIIEIPEESEEMAVETD